MLSVRGIYENGQVRLIESLPEQKRFKVIVTILEELKETENISSKPFVGSLRGAGKTIGDLTEPFEDEWEVD
ncbi:MAG: hypothetical protein HQK79_23170 [Desulfobacterales bacterium]|nr:hypothetical protein [Desulfobacterales bacterium]